MRSPGRYVRRLLGAAPEPKRKSTASHARGGTPPPEMPEGWAPGPPDFIGIGVQKSGTTWWWTLLTTHPDMVSRIKETHHLARLGWRPMSEPDIASYHAYFPRRDGVVTGEWTPRYMTLPGVPDVIRACAPDAKLITILRDPVERYKSGVGQWQKRKLRIGEPLELARGTKDAYSRSFYGFQLQRVVDVLGSDRLLVLQFERCKQDPQGELARTLEFVGLRPFDPPADKLGKPVNVTRTGKAELSDEDRAALVAAYEADVRLLKSLVPSLDLRLWPNFAHLADG